MVNFVEKIGIMKMLEEDRVGFMLASSALEFKKPLYYPDNISPSFLSGKKGEKQRRLYF